MLKTLKNAQGEKIKIEVSTGKPTNETYKKLVEILDTFNGVDVLEEGRKAVATVNKAMLTNAIDDVLLHADGISKLFARILQRPTYGKYAISKKASDSSYTLTSVDVVNKLIPTGKKDSNGKTIQESRIDYIDFEMFYKRNEVLQAEIKKQKPEFEKASLLQLFSLEQIALFCIFINNVTGKELTPMQKARLENMGDTFKRFADTSNTALFEQLCYIYDVFNAKTGEEVKPITVVVSRIQRDKDLHSFSSKYYSENTCNEVKAISILFNYYINCYHKTTAIVNNKMLDTDRAITLVEGKKEDNTTPTKDEKPQPKPTQEPKDEPKTEEPKPTTKKTTTKKGKTGGITKATPKPTQEPKPASVGGITKATK